MTTKLHWTANGIPYNAYNDGYINKYKAVKGTELKIDSLSDFELFTYEFDNKTFIVFAENGISITNGTNLENAIEKLENNIQDYGLGTFLKLITEKFELLPSVPEQAPTIENEIIEVSTVSMKTGEIVA